MSSQSMTGILALNGKDLDKNIQVFDEAPFLTIVWLK